MLATSMVGVAQLVESRIVIPVVVGSSPIVHPSIFKHLALYGLGAFSFMGHSAERVCDDLNQQRAPSAHPEQRSNPLRGRLPGYRDEHPVSR